MLPHLAGLQDVDLFFIHCVPVLFQETITLILNLKEQINMYRNMAKLSYLILEFIYPLKKKKKNNLSRVVRP